MNLLGMFPFTAPYLAWVFLILSAVLGSPLETDLVSPRSFFFFFPWTADAPRYLPFLS